MNNKLKLLGLAVLGATTLAACSNSSYQDKPEVEIGVACNDNKCDLDANVEEVVEHYKAGKLVNTKHIAYKDSKYKNDKVTYDWNLQSADPSGKYVSGDEYSQDVDFEFSDANKDYNVEVTSKINDVTGDSGISKVIDLKPKATSTKRIGLELRADTLGLNFIYAPINKDIFKDVFGKSANVDVSVELNNSKKSGCHVVVADNEKHDVPSDFSYTKDIDFGSTPNEIVFVKLICENADADLNVNVKYKLDGKENKYEGSFSQVVHVKKFNS